MDEVSGVQLKVNVKDSWFWKNIATREYFVKHAYNWLVLRNLASDYVVVVLKNIWQSPMPSNVQAIVWRLCA